MFADGDDGGGSGDLLDLDGGSDDGDKGGDDDGDKGDDSDGDSDDGDDDSSDHKESIYGPLEVKWPEGTPDELKNIPTLKPFVNKEGEVNVANLLKSYVDTKKSFGNKIAIPSEHATDDEWADFYEKVAGHPKEIDKYEVTRPEESKISPEFFESIKAKLHASKVPAAQANEFFKSLEEESVKFQSDMDAGMKKKMDEEVQGLKKEWGAAFDQNAKAASSVVIEYGDDEFKQYAKDSGLTSDVKFTKFLLSISNELNSEAPDRGTKGNNNAGFLTPGDAVVKINEMRGDAKHPFNDKNHPSHNDAVEEMKKLYEMKNAK
jgi:hypothetical protein